VLAAAVGVVYRRPNGAVVTVQRVRRRLHMSRLDSTPAVHESRGGWPSVWPTSAPCYRAVERQKKHGCKVGSNIGRARVRASGVQPGAQPKAVLGWAWKGIGLGSESDFD